MPELSIANLTPSHARQVLESGGAGNVVKPNLITLPACRVITAGILSRSLHPVTHRQARHIGAFRNRV